MVIRVVEFSSGKTKLERVLSKRFLEVPCTMYNRGMYTPGMCTHGMDTRGMDARGMDTRGMDTRGMYTRGIPL